MRPAVPAALYFFLFSFSVSAQELSLRPTLGVPRASAPIIVDGQLNDPGWTGAAATDNFTQFQPVDRVKPKVRTVARVTYDQHYLYLGFMCYDDPATIRSTLTDRDHMFDDDFVGIVLDTRGDAAWAYEFYVNPLGVQGDLRWMTTGDEDSRFDVVYTAEAIKTDSGWQAEMAIPFSSLQFPDQDEQTWRANFWRSHPRDNVYKYTWALWEQGMACHLCEMGYWTGIAGVRPGSRFDILPALVGFQSGTRRDTEDLGSPFENADPDAQAELNARYGLGSGVTIEATVNPDFSQVESDAAQIEANNTFALNFPERRPFFQEGGDLYDTEIDAIYTRAINDPEAALKLTGRQGSTSYFFLSASDDNSPLTIPLAERSEFVPLGKTYSNLGRVRHMLGGDAHIGALFTDRRVDAGEGANTVYGIDGAVRVLKDFRVAFQALGSRTTEVEAPLLSAEYLAIDSALQGIDSTFDGGRHSVALDGESFEGWAAKVAVSRESRLWRFDAEYGGSSPNFRADNGFIFRTGIHEAQLNTGLVFRPNGRVFTRVQPSMTVGRIWEWDGARKDEWVVGAMDLTLRGPWYLGCNMLLSREMFRTVWFEDIRRVDAWFESASLDRARFGASINYGNAIARNVDPLPVMGRQLTGNIWVSFKPLQQFTIEPNWEYARMRDRDTGERIFEGYVLRTRLNYQFTRRLFTRLIVQYDDFDDQFNVEPLLTYKVNPFTIFYIGSTSRYAWRDADDLGGRLVDRQFFVKLQYLFRV